MSGFCKNALLSNGLNNPDVFKFLSTIIEISAPISFLLKISLNFLKFLSSIDKGETATGSGLRFPLVISTSIKACWPEKALSIK